MYIYTSLIFIFVEYEIQNNTGWFFGIVLHQVNRLVQACLDQIPYSYYLD